MAKIRALFRRLYLRYIVRCVVHDAPKKNWACREAYYAGDRNAPVCRICAIQAVMDEMEERNGNN